jgi:hypothetical protein
MPMLLHHIVLYSYRDIQFYSSFPMSVFFGNISPVWIIFVFNLKRRLIIHVRRRLTGLFFLGALLPFIKAEHINVFIILNHWRLHIWYGFFRKCSADLSIYLITFKVKRRCVTVWDWNVVKEIVSRDAAYQNTTSSLCLWLLHVKTFKNFMTMFSFAKDVLLFVPSLKCMIIRQVIGRYVWNSLCHEATFQIDVQLARKLQRV